MRNLSKLQKPQILQDNEEVWTTEYMADPDNSTKKFRYRDQAIKSTLVEETSEKCVYCESKIGHNTPGDTEHIVPSSVDPQLHFAWHNMTIACTECNRRKGAYYDARTPFLNPYSDDVESMIVHHGPIVGWIPGNTRAEATVSLLQLHDSSRHSLVTRKIEKIVEVNHMYSRLQNESADLMKKLLAKRLEEMRDRSAEFSGMVGSICRTNDG